MQHGLTIEVHTMGRTVDEQTVDQWELKAATRALNNLRTLGAGKPLTELLRDQIDVGDNFHRSLIASSDGTFRESRTELRVRGLTGPGSVSTWSSPVRSTAGVMAGCSSSAFTSDANNRVSPRHA